MLRLRSTILGVMTLLLVSALSAPARASDGRLEVLDHFADEDALFLAVYDHVAGRTHGFDADEELRIAEAVLAAALREGVDPFLILAVIHVESSFSRWAKSSVGALGLMQVKPSTGEPFAAAAGVHWRGPASLFHIESNIAIGTHYLAFKLERFDDDVTTALAAYCHGPTRIRRILRTQGGLDSDRLRYSERVLRMHRHFRGAAGLPVG